MSLVKPIFMSKPSQIKTQRLLLIPFTGKFLSERYASWLNDPQVVQFSEQRHKKHSMVTCREYFLGFRGSENFLWAIVVAETGIHIGNISAYLDQPNSVADVGILIGEKSCWGQGYGLEAWEAVNKFLFDKIGIRKLTAGAMSINKGMISIMKKSGMVPDGIRRDQFLVNGKSVDMVMAAKLNKKKN